MINKSLPKARNKKIIDRAILSFFFDVPVSFDTNKISFMKSFIFDITNLIIIYKKFLR